jgi:signal transduction histidine kinase
LRADPKHALSPRGAALFAASRQRANAQTDRMFMWLLAAQWVFAVALALVTTPHSYERGVATVHVHVKAAIGIGAVLNALPLFLIQVRPGWWLTRHAIAVAQVGWSALLIVLTGGRIDTHFHEFGSLAFLAFYRDPRVLGTATVAIALGHVAHAPSPWEFFEHLAWIAFEAIVLVVGCTRSLRELRTSAEHEAENERGKQVVEEQVRARTRELETSVERYQGLVENTEAIPFEYDPNTRQVLYMAPQAARLLDCHPAELLGDGFFRDRLPDDDRIRVQTFIHDFLGGIHVRGESLDFRLLGKTGRAAVVRLFLSEKAGRNVRGIQLDVTRQHRLEAELRHAQKLESVGRLAAGVAHEINTPIQFVSDSVQFAREAVDDLVKLTGKLKIMATAAALGDDRAAAAAVATEVEAATTAADLDYIADEVPRALERALAGTQRVARIVRSMNQLAHPGATEMTAADLNASIESTIAIASSAYRDVADIHLALGHLPPVVCLAGELNQAILNLVSNAADAIADVVAGTRERGAITVTSRADGDFVVISIADTGGGIPDTVRDHVFDPFFTTKEVGRGTGQGLAICRTVVVDKHAGTLTFETEAGRGTTFHLRIPIRPPSAPVETAA